MASGDPRSDTAVKPRMSLKKTDMFRRTPPSFASSGFASRARRARSARLDSGSGSPRADRSARTRESRADALARLITARTALRDVAHAVAHERAPEPAAIDIVNRTLASRERIELIAANDGVRLGHSHLGDPVDHAMARIAEPIVREIGAGHDDRIRVCANDTCRWLFYDESRAGRRRWCDMATCGNQAKARRHRERQKQLAVATPTEVTSPS